MTRGRRDNRAGTVYQEPDGRWRAEIRWTDHQGRRHRSRASAPDEQAARRALAGLQREVAAGRTPANQRVTVDGYWRVWRDGPLRAAGRKASTVQLYTSVMTQHVLPELGGMRLAAVTAGDVERMLAGMTRKRAMGGQPAGVPVSGQTRRTAHAVLCLMLSTAVRDGLLPVNVAAQVDRPQPDTAEAGWLTAGQLRDLLGGLVGHRIYPLVLLLASTGMRLGEGLGLRWDDVDLQQGLLRVTGTVRGSGAGAVRTTPKSLRSRRTLPISPEVVQALTGWRAVQAAERLRAGTAWHTGEHAWVFTTAGGYVLDQRNAARQYQRALLQAGLDVPARFHLLRHTAASLMLADAAVPLRVASEVLGHGSTRLTADTYAHVDATHKRAALGVIGQALA